MHLSFVRLDNLIEWGDLSYIGHFFTTAAGQIHTKYLSNLRGYQFTNTVDMVYIKIFLRTLCLQLDNLREIKANLSVIFKFDKKWIACSLKLKN